MLAHRSHTGIYVIFIFNSHRRICLLILEREEGRKRERNIDRLPLICTLTRDRTCGLGTCLDWGSNQQPFGVQDDAPTNGATQLGEMKAFLLLFLLRRRERAVRRVPGLRGTGVHASRPCCS